MANMLARLTVPLGDDAIPEADLEIAIAQSLRTPYYARYYGNAPAAARLFIELQFYMTVFPEALGGARLKACLAIVEPRLGLVDIDYLLEGEEDLQTIGYLQQLRGRLVPREAPPLRYMPGDGVGNVEKPKRKGKIMEKNGSEPEQPVRHVSSEYERQKRAYQNERRKTGAVRMLKALGVLVLFIALFAIFGVGRYAIFESEQADARAKLEIARPKVPGIEADRELLKDRLEKMGYGRTKLAEVERMRSYKRLLEDPQFCALDEKYLGAFSVAKNPGTLDQLARQIQLDEKIQDLKTRDSMLARTLSGASANSPSHRADVERVSTALKEARERYRTTKDSREQAMAAVVRKVGDIGAAITARLDAVTDLERKLEEGRELRNGILSRLPFGKKVTE